MGCLTISFNTAAISAVIPAISLDLCLPAIVVSKIIPFYMIPYGICALLFAPLTRFVSYKAILSCSMVIYAVSSLYCAGVTEMGHFLAARMIMGLSAAGAIPLGLILIGQLFEKKIRGRLVGLFFTCSFLSSIVGIFLSGTAHWRWLFYIPAILGLLTALSITLYQSDLMRRIHGAKVNYLRVYTNARIRNVFIFIFALSFLYHGVHNWFGVYLSSHYHLDKLSISFFFMLIAVSSAFGQMTGGYLTDKRSRFLSCHVGVILLAVTTMLLAGHYPLIVLAVILALFSIGWTVGHNGASTVLTDFPEENRPEIASLNSSVRFTSGGI
ncbi:MAG: MFS transporter, partial [Candidatus Omnitrophota bacterium]